MIVGALLTIGALVLLGVPAVGQSTDQLRYVPTINDSGSPVLLGPYFEVDLSNPTGMNTIFTLNHPGSTSIQLGSPQSSGATAGLTRITVWSDLGVPVLGFNMYLTGYDVDRIDMRKVLNGTLPQTATAGQDPFDQVSPKGSRSQDINFASCSGVLPPFPLGADLVANLQASLTGKPNPTGGAAGKCAGSAKGDNVARGYITIDMVNSCGTQGPADNGYISNVLTPYSPGYSNVLTGEVYYVDQLHGVVRGDEMVHIHADANDPSTNAPGDYTFYGRYDGFNGSDFLQPLPNDFNARYLNGNLTGAVVATSTAAPTWGNAPVGPRPGSTSLVVWRDSKVSQTFFTCGNLPSPYPLPQEDITAFDEQEHPQSLNPNGSGKFVFPTAFPLATQVVKVGSTALPVSFTSGWIYLNLNHNASGGPNPTADPLAAQAWVQVIEQNGSQVLNLMHRAQAADSGTQPAHVIVN